MKKVSFTGPSRNKRTVPALAHRKLIRVDGVSQLEEAETSVSLQQPFILAYEQTEPQEEN